VAIAPPFLGIPKYTVYPLSLSEEIFFEDDSVEPEQLIPIFKELVNKFPVLYDLQVKDFYRRYRNEPWMLSIMSRVKQERNRNDNQVSESVEEVPEVLLSDDSLEGKIKALKDTFASFDIMNIFPYWKISCFEENRFNYLNSFCYSGLYDFWKFGEVLDEDLCPAQYEDIFSTYGYD
jgi:hypothetical protein